MSPMRAFPGCQRGKRPPILLTTKWKVMMEGKLRKKSEKMVRMRVTMEERMTRTRVELKGEPLKKEIQEVPGMATLVHLFSPKCGPLMTLSRR